jgi:hypothetical protein
LELEIVSVERTTSLDESSAKSFVATVVVFNKSRSQIVWSLAKNEYNEEGCFCAFYHVGLTARSAHPVPKLSGQAEYGKLPSDYGVLGPGAKKEFNLLLHVPKEDMQQILEDSKGLQVLQIALGLGISSIRVDGKRTDLWGQSRAVPEHWRPPTVGQGGWLAGP